MGGGKRNHEAMLRDGDGGVDNVVEEEPVATTEETAAADATAVNTSFTSMSSDDRLLMSKVFSRSGASCVLTIGIRPRSDSCLITTDCCLIDIDIFRKRHRKMAAVVANDPFIILWHPL